MKKFKGYLAILILFVSWCTLFWLTGSRTPWNLFAQAEGEGVSVHLGDIAVENYDRMGFTKGIVKYVEAENGWLVGTERGELFLFGSDGRQLWKRSLGIGKLISAALTGDTRLAFVGESSPDGNLYCVDVHTGDVLWKLAAAQYIGSDPGKRSYPAAVHIALDKEDCVYVNIYRFLTSKDGGRGYYAKMLAVGKDGRLRWQYPEREAMDSWINWCDVSDANGRAVLSTSAYDFRADMKYKDTMYFLDKKTGALLNSVFVPPVEPFDNTVMRGSPNFAANGEYLAGAASDGRGMLFDKEGRIIWTRTLSKPTQIDGAWINASGRDGFVFPGVALFTTINTFNRENWQLPTPVEHPGNNSLFAFNLDGSYRYQFQARGTMEMLAFSQKGLAACAVGRNVRTHDYQAHGALILDFYSGRQKHFFHTEGPVQAVDISGDGTQAAALEVPALTPDGRLLGAHRLWIWRLQEKDVK